ncbi:MAG: UDP-3-O-acyl-N-acetylglucosamine deacetylase, partial [Bacteroidales bacterium]|nr:UDP-3-O-acyl-N-acetylglucosamine deacetylase [Bacteroidales bacterium]
MHKQTTLKGSFTLFGKGLHTGLPLTVTFNPAPENHGYKIQRIDLEDAPIIEAIAENVVDTSRGTVLAKGDVRVSTIEHGMAALYALGIDNCLIQVTGPEFPILDGSSKFYVEKIEDVGIEEQNAPKNYYVIKKKIEVRDEATGSVITILPDEEFSVTSMISFDSKFINSQFATLSRMSDFTKEISCARTFVFVREILPLLGAGLIKGGDLSNAIVIYEKEVSQPDLDQLADQLGVPHMDATKLGYLTDLVWQNEPARHKLLDIIGDMALIGRPI